MKRAAIYLRVSTQDQTTSNQEHELREAAERADWRVAKVYKDHGISGAFVHVSPFSRRFRLNAALINPMCVNACGKLPSASPDGPICSAYSPRWLA